MDNKSSDIRLIQLNNYVKPKIEENKSKDWVLNGKNNSFYQYIIDRNNGSPTNGAINKSYANMIYGKGLYKKSGTTADWVAFMTMLRPRELRKICYDFQLFGEASFQKINAKGKNELPSLYHIPKQKISPTIANEDDEIEGYWYSRDWSKQGRPENRPELYPAFGTSKDSVEIYNIKPYKAGNDYFADPDYIAGLPYAEMEEEISNYYISHIKNGLSFGYIINIPDGNSLSPEEKDDLEKKIKQKLVGSSNAGKFVLSFNGRDAEITVTPLTVNDAHKQWAYLTEEARQQLLTSHLCTSTSLVGVSTTSGFSSTADEMAEARAQLLVNVIQPKQDYIIEALEDVAMFYGLNLELGFKPLVEVKQGATKTELSAHVCCSDEKKKTDLDAFIELGEDEDLETYDLIDEIEVDYEEEVKLQLASTGVARPNAKSSQDGEDFIVRYKYVGNPAPEREFCQKMMLAGKIYRKEDILQLDNKVVNAGWGANGANTYSIWLYKGGGNCHHKWNRVIYLKKGRGVDVNSPLAEIISTSEARRRGMKLETNDTKVSVEPRNMTNKGFLKPR